MTGVDFVTLCLENGKIALLTLWENGSIIYEWTEMHTISAIPTDTIIDATGCGDAYRAWLLYGLSEGWDIIESAKLGSIIASIKIRHFGWQNHHLSKDEINELGKLHFGKVFFA
jgi:adenosine kinase